MSKQRNTIRDTSATGIGIVVSGDLEGSDVGLDTVGMSFTLPDMNSEVDPPGTIRHKKLDMDATPGSVTHRRAAKTDSALCDAAAA